MELEFEFEQLRTFRAMQVPHSVLGGGGGRAGEVWCLVVGWLGGCWGLWLGDGVVGWVMGWLVE